LIAIATIRTVATYPETGLTFDEPGHMACGLQYLAQHVYLYEAQHPPLARVMSALGPYLDGARPLGVRNQDQEGVAVIYHDGHPFRTLTLMRLGILPFFLLVSLVVYFWAVRYFGGAVAVFATGLFTMIPPVLAHAGLATTDMPLTACLSAAFFSLVLWAGKPTWKLGLLLGLTTALAVLSKFTALGFLPAAAVLALVPYLVVERPGMKKLAALAKERAATFALAALTGALVIWAAYSFSFGKVPGWSVPLPAPSLFEGVRFAMFHNDKGHAAYLFGEVRNTGWWYFFPVVLALKTPIAFLLLLGSGTLVCWRKRAEFACWLPLAFSLGILVPSMTSHVNIGTRHVLPVYVGFSIVAALGLNQLARWARAWKPAGTVAGLLVLWMAFSGAIHHPDYLAYFNEFVGGEPDNVLVDSDLDWGQDTVRLARRLRQLGVTEVSFTIMNMRSDLLQAWPGLPPSKPINPLTPVEGWTAVSPTFWKIRQYGLYYRYRNIQPWFAYLTPVERVGSFLLYYVPPGTLSPPAPPAR
jgi:4-amino-4-deoxy-L-arabinose transferase-like glycosyltransferase